MRARRKKRRAFIYTFYQARLRSHWRLYGNCDGVKDAAIVCMVLHVDRTTLELGSMEFAV